MIKVESTTVAALDPVLRSSGLDAQALDAAHLRWVLRSRMNACGVRELPAYLDKLKPEAPESDALVEALLVQETRFFRDPAVFRLLGQSLVELAESSAGPLRMASAPCSTGQEAYSLAALATLAGLQPEQFSVDAFDISQPALDAAQSGQYPPRSADHVSDDQRTALGEQRNGQFTVWPQLRESVRFERRNLVEADALGAQPSYHIILCRNLFIYIHASARRTLAMSLAKALLPGGRIVLGSGDHVPEVSELFTPVQPAASFAFAPIEHRNATPRTQPRAAIAKLLNAIKPKRAAAERAPAPLRTTVEPTHLSAKELVQRAQQARSAGNIRLAERRCRQALYVDPEYLQAMEMLESLWHSGTSMRMRRALEARIHRRRNGVTAQDGGRD